MYCISVYCIPEYYICVLYLSTVPCMWQVEHGVAIVRPPGHHAEAEETCGFCYFNNVAVAAKYAQHKYAAQKVHTTSYAEGIHATVVASWTAGQQVERAIIH